MNPPQARVSEPTKDLLSVMVNQHPEEDAKVCKSSDNSPLYNTMVMLSYGGDTDLLLSSACTRTSTVNRSAFTQHSVFYIISTVLIQPICCIFFFFYYKATRCMLLFTAGLLLTILHHFRLIIMLLCVYRNIRSDLLPLSTSQQLLLGIIVVTRTMLFCITAYYTLFIDTRVFFLITGHLQSEVIFPDSVSKILPVSWGPSPAVLLVMAAVIYAMDCLVDTVSFIGPRVWVRVMLKTSISF
uniref:ORF39 n=1 Tax=Human herpesvirus 3 TaxID=10335 RepID=A0A1C9CWZ0_HHV3|nr:ORF39 [Human alphaherpesvirus 3]